MTREEKIKAIYEKVADRTLNRGCKFTHDGIEFIHSGNTNSDEIILECIEEGTTYIIGHPVMIGDVLDYIDKTDEENDNITGRGISVLNDWEKLRKPIEEQSAECINYIYNLIK